MKKYKVLIGNFFQNFEYGDILYPFNDGEQWGFKGCVVGGNCIPKEVIEKLPDFFEEIDDNWEEIWKEFEKTGLWAKEFYTWVSENYKSPEKL